MRLGELELGMVAEADLVWTQVTGKSNEKKQSCTRSLGEKGDLSLGSWLWASLTR